MALVHVSTAQRKKVLMSHLEAIAKAAQRVITRYASNLRLSHRHVLDYVQAGCPVKDANAKHGTTTDRSRAQGEHIRVFKRSFSTRIKHEVLVVGGNRSGPWGFTPTGSIGANLRERRHKTAAQLLDADQELRERIILVICSILGMVHSAPGDGVAPNPCKRPNEVSVHARAPCSVCTNPPPACIWLRPVQRRMLCLPAPVSLDTSY